MVKRTMNEDSTINISKAPIRPQSKAMTEWLQGVSRARRDRKAREGSK